MASASATPAARTLTSQSNTAGPIVVPQLRPTPRNAAPSVNDDGSPVQERLEPVAALRRYARGRAEHVKVLEDLDATAWQRRGRHSEHGLMTIELYEAHVASEDIDHLAQIARTLGLARGH